MRQLATAQPAVDCALRFAAGTPTVEASRALAPVLVRLAALAKVARAADAKYLSTGLALVSALHGGCVGDGQMTLSDAHTVHLPGLELCVHCIALARASAGEPQQQAGADEPVADLQELFTSAHALLLELVNVLLAMPAGSTATDDATPNDSSVQAAAHFCACMLQLCEACHRDLTLVNYAWKSLVRMTGKHAGPQLARAWDAAPALAHLHRGLQGAIEALPFIVANERDAVERKCKVARFYLVHLCTLCRQFGDQFARYTTQLAHAACAVKGALMRTTGRHDVLDECRRLIVKQVVPLTDAWIGVMAQQVAFLRHLCTDVPLSAPPGDELALGRWLCLLICGAVIRDATADAQGAAWADNLLLASLFAGLRECFVDLALPLCVYRAGHDDERIEAQSLYCYARGILGALIAASPEYAARGVPTDCGCGRG